jgi:hypothetical protein
MTRTRLGGATLLVGSVALILVMLVALVVSDPLHGGVVALTALTIEAVASVLVLLGMPAILAGQGHRVTRLGLAGYVGVFANVAFVNLFLSLTFAIVLPWAADQGMNVDGPPPPAIGAALFVSVLVQIVCTGLLAASVLRSREYSRWSGWLLLGSTALAILSAVPVAGIARYAAAITLYAALGLIGLQLAAGTVGEAPADEDAHPVVA